MNFPEVLQRITVALDRAGVAYMLAGSFASAYYGSLRSTQDMDLVIAATPQQLQRLIQGLPSGEYYADLDAALEAFKRESMFNVIDLRTGWKIDMIICKSRAFSQEEFGRRRLSLQGISPSPALRTSYGPSSNGRGSLNRNGRIEDAAGILKYNGAG